MFPGTTRRPCKLRTGRQELSIPLPSFDNALAYGSHFLRKLEDARNKNTVTLNQREIARDARDSMVSRMRNKRSFSHLTTGTTPETTVDLDNPAQTTTESADPETTRKRSKKENDNLSAALSTFGHTISSAITSFGEKVSGSESVREEVRKVVKDEIEEGLRGVRTELNNNMSSILQLLEAMRREASQ